MTNCDWTTKRVGAHGISAFYFTPRAAKEAEISRNIFMFALHIMQMVLTEPNTKMSIEQVIAKDPRITLFFFVLAILAFSAIIWVVVRADRRIKRNDKNNGA